MKRLSDVKRYYIDFMNNKIVEDPNGLYMECLDVEPLVSDLDDAFEHCKMDLESTKATVEELQIKIEKANQLIRKMSDVAQIDVDLNTYDVIY